MRRLARVFPFLGMQHDVFFGRGGKLTFKKGDEEQPGTYKIDPSKKPRHIDLTVREKEINAIYEFKDDTLRICAGGPGDERPTEFKSEEGGRSMLITLRREKTKE